MSNDITSILQTLAPQHKRPEQSPVSQTRSTSQPAVTEKPATLQGDRVTLTDSARLLQLADSKSGRLSAPQLDSSDVGMSSARTGSSIEPAPSALTAAGNAQRPSPAMANMMEAFLTTSDMEGFNADSDLNADGVINFQDLAALRDIEIGAGQEPPGTPETLLNAMTESFFSSKDSKAFDAASDFNNDGMINFEDLAILRSKIENS